MPLVLVVECWPDTGDFLESLLSHSGHEVERATGIAEALEALRRRRPGVMVVNPMLSDGCGFDLCRTVTAARATCLLPLVILSSLGDPEYRIEGYRSGAHVYLRMPFTPATLSEAVAWAVAWKECHTAHGGAGEIVYGVGCGDVLLRQANDLRADLLARTRLPEGEVHGLRQALIEVGEAIADGGRHHDLDRLLTVRYAVRPDRIDLVIRDHRPGRSGCVPSVGTELRPRLGRLGFVERHGDEVVLSRSL